MIAPVAGREGEAQTVRVDGTQGRLDRTGVSPQRRVRPHAGDAVPRHASRTGVAPRPHSDRAGPRRRERCARNPGDRARVPNFQQAALTHARRPGHPIPPDRLPDRAHASFALARLRARASRSAVAGRPSPRKSAHSRHPASSVAPFPHGSTAVPLGAPGGTSAQAARRGRWRPRALRLRRSRPRHLEGPPFVGRGAPYR